MGFDKISAEVVLLVEGPDDQTVVSLLLSSIATHWRPLIDVQAVADGGGLEAGLGALATVSGFDRVKKVAVLVDADQSPEEAHQRWARHKTEFAVNHAGKQLSFCVLPSHTVKGALESLFLQSLNINDPGFTCVQALVACLGDHSIHTTQAQKDKLALTTYINSRVKNPYSRIGVALKQDARALFDFKHPAFKPLVEFLEDLIHV